MTRPDLTSLKIGFIPLVDCAPLIVAEAMGFAAAQGLRLDLVREASWANIRDRVVLGHFDAAHMLAPMTIAGTIGLGAMQAALVAPFVLNRGGNAVCISRDLARRMAGFGLAETLRDAAGAGRALKAAIAARAAEGLPALTFGVVYPFSAQNYDVRYWLAASGIDPDQDVRLIVIPPPYMSDALAAGQVDGFCVGAPWPALSAESGVGRLLTTKQAIWPSSPEKVLGLRADWASRHPDTLARLIRALDAAARWCGTSDNLTDLAQLLARPEWIGVPADIIMRGLTGRLLLSSDSIVEHVPHYMVYSGDGTNRPRVADALFYAAQMLRWRQTQDAAGARAAARAAFDPAAYDDALGLTGAEPDLTPFTLFDGEVFDPAAAG